ncbi:TRAP transporter small permease subunit [Rhodoligotrophos defluvii]|uniref:TRAP transporter small permease subunit n=1 Tax=Rhodoligotrophos defluvii TaxID=2561934 RepID=UPI0010C9C6E9|nr:TRAP transporter small permease [Rhodoligotrophos defluvii]
MEPNTRRSGAFAALIDRADGFWRRIARLMLIAGGWGVMLIGVMVAVDVLSRYLVGRNLGGVDEIAGYLFAIGISWSLAEAFYARSHVRIDFLYHRFPLPLRAILDVVALVALLLLAAFLIFSGWIVVSGSWARASRSASSLHVPLIIPQLAWLAGFLVFLIALALSGLRALLELGRADFGQVNRQLGVLTPTEEAEDAVKPSSGAT